jgi:hypothetical protein
MYTSILAALLSAAAPAETFYVRVDGGSAMQCDGRHDVAFTPAARHGCAWNHPFVALPPGGKARIAGGDTLLISPGNYRMGQGAPGTESLEKCRDDWPWDCHVGGVPAGPSPQRPTRILGAGFDQGCAQPPQLWGTQRAAAVLDLSDSANLEVACLEITDHASCIEFHNAPGATQHCERDHAPFGDWASVGINAARTQHVRLADLDIHGLAHDGIRAGALSDWTLERVHIVGNGWSGWNGDVGDASADEGTMVFRDVEIAWNGCGERYPGRERFGCWGEQEGGYGDGLGTGDTGGSWLFDRVHVHHNTQDGIDLLHARATTHVVFRDVQAEANAGNQLKATGVVQIQHATVNGNCSELNRHNSLESGNSCRAYGNSISLHLPAHSLIEIADSTIEGEGDCLIDLQCADSCDGGSASISGNRLRGVLRETPGAKPPCSLWIAPEARAADVHFERNQLRGVRSSACPHGATCTDNRTQRD